MSGQDCYWCRFCRHSNRNVEENTPTSCSSGGGPKEKGPAIWQQISDWLKDLISLLESEYHELAEESSSEEKEEEIDH